MTVLQTKVTLLKTMLIKMKVTVRLGRRMLKMQVNKVLKLKIVSYLETVETNNILR